MGSEDSSFVYIVNFANGAVTAADKIIANNFIPSISVRCVR